MIADGLLILIYGFVWVILTPFRFAEPVSVNNAITSAIVSMKTYYTALSSIVPLDTIAQIVLFDLVFEAAFWAYKGVRWVYRKIPGIT